MTPKGGIKPHKKFTVQANRSEVLFVDYIAEHIHPSTGRAGIIVPEGIIFQNAGAYKQLRKMLVDKNYLYAVVSLPAGVFHPYSGVKTCILLMDKTLAKKTDNILFVKIVNDGFDLGAQRRANDKNDLTGCLELLQQYKTALQNNTTFASDNKNVFLVEKEKIAANTDYNLSIDRYRVNENSRQSNFEMVEIGEICNLINGRAFKPSDWEKKENGGLPIIRIQNLNTPTSEFNYYSGEVVEKYLVNKGDLLFSWSGSRGTSFGAHIWYGDKAILNQHIFRIEFSDRVIKEFLYYVLNEAVTEIEENLHGGVGLVHITKGNMEKIKIPIPSIEVQKQIINKIESYKKNILDFKNSIEDEQQKIRTEIGKLWKAEPKEYGITKEKLSTSAEE
jgi:type I restriction enzyme M protein